MKRKQFTRLLSLLLALVLATGLVSPALAAESRVSDTLVPWRLRRSQRTSWSSPNR